VCVQGGGLADQVRGAAAKVRRLAWTNGGLNVQDGTRNLQWETSKLPRNGIGATGRAVIRTVLGAGHPPERASHPRPGAIRPEAGAIRSKPAGFSTVIRTQSRHNLRETAFPPQ